MKESEPLRYTVFRTEEGYEAISQRPVGDVTPIVLIQGGTIDDLADEIVTLAQGTRGKLRFDYQEEDCTSYELSDTAKDTVRVRDYHPLTEGQRVQFELSLELLSQERGVSNIEPRPDTGIDSMGDRYRDAAKRYL